METRRPKKGRLTEGFLPSIRPLTAWPSILHRASASVSAAARSLFLRRNVHNVSTSSSGSHRDQQRALIQKKRLYVRPGFLLPTSDRGPNPCRSVEADGRRTAQDNDDSCLRFYAMACVSASPDYSLPQILYKQQSHDTSRLLVSPRHEYQKRSFVRQKRYVGPRVNRVPIYRNKRRYCAYRVLSTQYRGCQCDDVTRNQMTAADSYIYRR